MQFKSLNGTGCLVNIYEDGYTGSGLTSSGKTGADVPFTVESGVNSLIGAATPIDWQEDNDTDMLNFIRTKTGYIRVIEQTYGELDGLYPTSLRQHFVEAYYGTERVFTGFMQCDEYSNDWTASPRELEFAVVSPLGLLDSFNFSARTSPGLTTLGEWMKEAMEGLNPSASGSGSDYASVIYPGSDYSPWNCQIHSTVFSPFNDDFKHWDTASNLFAPVDYKYFIDGICACFGWMVHDTPDGPVFSKYDAAAGTSYSKVPIANLVSLSGRSSVNQSNAAFGSYYEVASDDHSQTMVRPLKKIELKLEGGNLQSAGLTTDHATSYGLGGSTDGAKYQQLTQVGPDVGGDHIGTAIFTTGGEISSPGLFPVAYGSYQNDDKSVSLSPFWVLKYNTGWATGGLLIRASFFGMVAKNSSGYALLKIKMERGTSLKDMKSTGYSDLVVSLVIKVGNQYVNLTNDTLVSYQTMKAVTIKGSTGSVVPNKTLASMTGCSDVDGIMFRPTSGWSMVNGPIEVSIYHNTTGNLGNNEYLKFTEISLKNPSSVFENYQSYYNDRDKITLASTGYGLGEASLTVNFNNYQFKMGMNSFGDSSGYISANNPGFSYMFSPMNFLEVKVRRISASLSFNEYAARFTYWISGWRWRMVAKSFDMRDDQYTILLARSKVIE